MLVIVGLLVVFGSVIGGYLMHHGQISVLMQVSEFIIIIGAAVGAVLISNPLGVVKLMVTDTLALLKKNPYDQQAFSELLEVMYQLFAASVRGGLTELEKHVENPESSPLFTQYPSFHSRHHAVAFLADTVKVLLTDRVPEHTLAEILDLDLEEHEKELMHVPHALTRVADALPGFGIVAAVLGVIITMGSIGGEASEVGAKVAAALVGTFVGILLSYGLVAPIANAIEGRVQSEMAYLRTIRAGMLAFSRGDKPKIAVEFARRTVEPTIRPSFAELETLTKKVA